MEDIENKNNPASALILNALMKLDLGWTEVYPVVLARSEYVADDNTSFAVSLVVRPSSDEKQVSLSVRVSVKGMYYEDLLLDNVNSLWSTIQSAEMRGIIKEYVENLKKEGMSLMAERINHEGLADIHSFFIPQENADKKLKLNLFCKLAFKGQVFYGFDGIKQYCHIQEDDAMPFLLQRTGVISGGDERYYCYMFCQSAEDATSWMDAFLTLDFNKVDDDESMDEIIPAEPNVPPIVLYRDTDNYMSLWY